VVEAGAVKGGGRTGLFDGNLEFPLGDAGWRAFAARERCGVESTDDLDALTMRLIGHEPDLCYLPSASVYFMRGDPVYRGIASACSARTGKPEQSSVLIVARSNPAADWQSLRGARLGYINTYCTTSYFAPSILLAREGLALSEFFKAFPVAPWQGQIDAVVAGTIDATMVFEDVWLAGKDNAALTKVIARLDGLPTPPFLVRADDGGFAKRLKEQLVTLEAAAGTHPLYSGFSAYEEVRMASLFAAMAKLPCLPKLGTGART